MTTLTEKATKKVALIEVKPVQNGYIAKEMAGGLGKKIKLKDGVFGSLLTRYLTTFFNAPPIVLAQLSAVCRQHHHEVLAFHTAAIQEIDADVDIAIVLSSMVDYRNEVRFIQELKNARLQIRAVVVGSFGSAMPQIYEGAADCVIQGDPEVAL